MKAQKTNPGLLNKGMENFLSAPSPANPQNVNETQKVDQKTNQGMENFINPPSRPKTLSEEIKAESKQMPKNVVNDVEEKIKELERILANTKELDLTTFSKIVLEKSLRFRLLFITQKIYVVVVNESKTTIVRLNPPRWGGSSLRYLVSTCSTQYCKAVQKQTTKGKIITYAPLDSNNTDIDNDVDIFD